MDEKDWWKSKTVWGAVVALAGALSAMAGVEIDAASSNEAVGALTALAGAAGALVAIWGRFAARETLR